MPAAIIIVGGKQIIRAAIFLQQAMFANNERLPS
jgi:hypothetical protein